MCIAIHIPTSLPTHLPTYLPTYLSTYFPTYPPTYLNFYLPTYLPTYLPDEKKNAEFIIREWSCPFKPVNQSTHANDCQFLLQGLSIFGDSKGVLVQDPQLLSTWVD